MIYYVLDVQETIYDHFENEKQYNDDLIAHS